MNSFTERRLRFFRRPLYLLLFPLFVALNIENNYQHLIDYSLVWRELLLLTLLPLAAFLLSALALRSFRLAAIFSFPVYVLFYFGGTAKNWLDAHAPGFLSSFFLWLPLLLLAFVLYFFWLRRHRPVQANYRLYCNLLLLVYVAIEAGRFGWFPMGRNDLGDTRKQLSATYQPSAARVRPDIYYVILDGYTSSPVLKDLGLDHSGTDSFLLRRGFYLPQPSRSNYNFTAFSMSSTFNLDYLRRIDTNKVYYDNDYLPAVYSMYRSEWWPMLQKEGYTFDNCSNFPLPGAPSRLPKFDVWLQSYLYKPYNFLDYVNRSIGWHLPGGLRPRTSFADDDFAEGRHRQLAVLPGLIRETVARQQAAPKFLYAHFLVPHGPFVYDAQGRRQPKETKGYPGYLEHVRYANTLLQQTVLDIQRLQPPGRPYVLILQGDHGVGHRAPGKKHLIFETLGAWYFSHGDYRQLHPGFAQVNTFRVVANAFFGKQYPLLEHRSFFLRTVTTER